MWGEGEEMGRAHRVGAGRGLDLHLVGSEWVEDTATGPPWRIHPGSRQDGGVIGGLKKKKPNIIFGIIKQIVKP